jgi:hypothetical protein
MLWGRVEDLLIDGLTQTGVKVDSTLMNLLKSEEGWLTKSALG